MRRDIRYMAFGITVGCVIGGAAGLLFAPMGGRELRRRIGGTSREVGHKVQGVSSRGQDYIAAKRAQVEEAVRHGKEAAAEKSAELEAQVSAEA